MQWMTAFFHPLIFHIKVFIFVETENHAAQILHFIPLDRQTLFILQKEDSLL